jgi:hypothetical protein
MWLVIVVAAITLVGTLIGTLAWWRLADRWAESEHPGRPPRRPVRTGSEPRVIRRDEPPG